MKNIPFSTIPLGIRMEYFAYAMERIYVRLPNWMGDVVMATSFLSLLRETYPKAQIDAATRDYLLPLLWESKSVNTALAVSRRDEHAPLALSLWAKRIETNGYDGAFILPPSFSSALTPFLAGIPKRIGWRSDSRRILLTVPVKRDDPFYARPLVEQYRDLIVRSDGDCPTAVPPSVIGVTPKHRDAAKKAVLRCGLEPLKHPIIGINPAAAYGTAKQWLPFRFAMVADRLAKQTGGSVLLMGGGPGDDASHQRVLGFSGGGIAGQFLGSQKEGIAELIGLLEKTDLVISSDTGIAHTAAAVGRPLVAVFGSTLPSWTFPQGPATRVVCHPSDCSPCYLKECNKERHSCMENVKIDEVVRVALDLLEEHG